MTGTNVHDIHLDLADARELFHPAELDPIGGRPYAEAGLERILNRIRPRPDRPVRATLRLPADRVEFGRAEQFTRIGEVEMEVVDVRVGHG